MSCGRALSTHNGRGSSVRPSARPLRVTTLLLSFSRCLWMSSDTTRGQSSWFRPLDNTTTSTCAAHTSCHMKLYSYCTKTTPNHAYFICPTSHKSGIPNHHTHSHSTSPPQRWQQADAPWDIQALLPAAVGVWILGGQFFLHLSLAHTAAWSSMVGTSSEMQKQ